MTSILLCGNASNGITGRKYVFSLGNKEQMPLGTDSLSASECLFSLRAVVGGKGKAEVADSKVPASPGYQCTNAMALYKQLKGTPGEMKSPRDIAIALIAAVPANPVIDHCEAGGTGFINIFVSKTFVTGQIQRVLTKGVLPPPVEKMHITVDFSSPNIAKVGANKSGYRIGTWDQGASQHDGVNERGFAMQSSRWKKTVPALSFSVYG